MLRKRMDKSLPKSEETRTLDEIYLLGRLLDDQFRIPGTRFRFGLDGIIGLVPGVGDVLSLAVSAYIIGRASQLGLPRHVLGRMVWNTGVDFLVGAIPLFGDVFDFAHKANLKNIRLLEHHRRLPRAPRKQVFSSPLGRASDANLGRRHPSV